MCTSCSCSGSSDKAASGSDSPVSEANTFEVEGMTCGHCVSSVSEHVNQIEGVRDVSIDLASGRIEVRADRDISRESVEAAVSGAGYTLR